MPCWRKGALLPVGTKSKFGLDQGVDIARRQVPAHNVVIISRGFDIRYWLIVRVALVVAVPRRLTKAFGLEPAIPAVGTPHKFKRAIVDRDRIEGDSK